MAGFQQIWCFSTLSVEIMERDPALRRIPERRVLGSKRWNKSRSMFPLGIFLKTRLSLITGRYGIGSDTHYLRRKSQRRCLTALWGSAVKFATELYLMPGMLLLPCFFIEGLVEECRDHRAKKSNLDKLLRKAEEREKEVIKREKSLLEKESSCAMAVTSAREEVDRITAESV